MAKHTKRRHNEPDPKHRRRHNPFFARRKAHNPLPVAFSRAPAILGGAIAGGVASSYIPNAILKEKDHGLTGYLANAAVWILPLFLFARWADFALGWFAGGGTMLVGRIIDDYTGKTVVTYQMPLSSYYRPGAVPLPVPGNELLTVPRHALLPAGVPAGSPAIAKAKGTAGLAWASRFMTRSAA